MKFRLKYILSSALISTSLFAADQSFDLSAPNAFSAKLNTGSIYTTTDTGESQKTFREQQMPMTDHACAFYSLGFEEKHGNVRIQGTDLLLSHASNEEIRNLVAHEIFDKVINKETNAILTLDQILPGAKGYHEARENYRAQKKWANMDALDITIKEWAAREENYTAYVSKHIRTPYVMLEYFNDAGFDAPMTSSMDALAKILGIDLRIYVVAQNDFGHPLKGKLMLAHAFKGGDMPVNMFHASRIHFNRLETMTLMDESQSQNTLIPADSLIEDLTLTTNSITSLFISDLYISDDNEYQIIDIENLQAESVNTNQAAVTQIEKQNPHENANVTFSMSSDTISDFVAAKKESTTKETAISEITARSLTKTVQPLTKTQLRAARLAALEKKK